MHPFSGHITFGEIGDALPVIFSLIVIEGLLSVDNALAIAALAGRLPPKERTLALRLGIVGAYLFRAAALLIATWIIANPWVRTLGAAYLIYLMCSHLTAAPEEGAPGEERKPAAKFWPIFFSIQFIDLSLSVDNVIAAVALSSKFWVVCTGVFIGILALRLLVGACIRLLEKYPVLEPAAFLLVGYVGFILLAESTLHVEIGSLEKFTGIIAILAAAILYSRLARLRTFLDPIFKPLLWVMNGVRRGVEALLRPLGSVFTLIGLARKWNPRRIRSRRVRKKVLNRP